MSVSGDLATLTLADLFQNIEAHGRSGTLTVHGDGTVEHVYFHDGKVAALMRPGRTPLLDRLAGAGHLSQRRVDAARRRHRPGRRGVLATLIEDKVLREPDARTAASQFLFEDVADLIAAAQGEFRFRQDPDPPPECDADELTMGLSLPAGPLVLEAARRTDHWALIRKLIPSGSIHFLVRPGAACPSDVEDPELGAELLAALDGTRTVQEVADLFPQRRFAVWKLLSEFVRDRLVRAAEADDLVRVAGAISDTELSRARAILAHGLEAEPHHEGLLHAAAELAELQQDGAAAAACLKTIAHRQIEAGQLEAAERCLDKARELAPEDPAVWERALALAIQRGAAAQAVEHGLHLVELYRTIGVHQKAQAVLERLLLLAPDTLHLHQELARTLVDNGAPKSAVRGLIRAGKERLGRAQDATARELFTTALGIEPGNAEAALSIEMIDKDEYARRRERARRRRRWCAGLLATTVLSVLAWREARARIGLAEAEARIARERYIEWRDYRAAILLLEGVAYSHPLTFTALYDVRARVKTLTDKAADAPERGEVQLPRPR